MTGIFNSFLVGVGTTFAAIGIIVVFVFVLRLLTGSYRLWVQAGGKIPDQDVTEIHRFLVGREQEVVIDELSAVNGRIKILEMKNEAALPPLEIESRDQQLTELAGRKKELDEKLDNPVLAGVAARGLFKILRDDKENLPLFNAASASGDWELYLANYLVQNSGATMYGYHPADDEIFYKLATKEARKLKLVNTGEGEFDLVSKSGALKYRCLHFKRDAMTPFIEKVGRNEQG